MCPKGLRYSGVGRKCLTVGYAVANLCAIGGLGAYTPPGKFRSSEIVFGALLCPASSRQRVEKTQTYVAAHRVW